MTKQDPKKMYATVSISKQELENSKLIEGKLTELIAARIAKTEQALIDEAVRIYLSGEKDE